MSKLNIMEQVEVKTLPIKVNYPYNVDVKKEYSLMGIEILGETKDDNLTFDVILPNGWEYVRTDHGMWFNLIDDKDRKRASIFKKYTSYELDTFINFNQAINFKVDRLGFLNGDYSMFGGKYTSENTPFVGRVTNFKGDILFETQHMQCYVEYNPDGKGYTYEYRINSSEIMDELRRECIHFLKDNFPRYEEINVYWD